MTLLVLLSRVFFGFTVISYGYYLHGSGFKYAEDGETIVPIVDEQPDNFMFTLGKYIDLFFFNNGQHIDSEFGMFEFNLLDNIF